MAAELAESQSWSAESYDRNARFVSDLGGDVLAWLAPAAGEKILDVGCGDGALTARIAESGAEVIGIDPSEDLRRRAIARGLDIRAGDVRTIDFDQTFDAVFSNAVLHWVKEADTAARRMAAALKPDGRLVAEFGGHGNVAAIATALRAAAGRFGLDAGLAAPWFYPTPAEYRQILEEAGLTVDQIALMPRPTPLPTGIEGWLMTFRKPFFDLLAPDVRDEALNWVTELLRPALCDASGQWTADYVRLRVRAFKAEA